ncbi:trimeric intracellular cation channel family protein [Thiomicrorhabdus sp.]|uniref:trimeric intracellular cation channel family protein n=1 Tax=Thiomicrorhabdus sp. TaxID=2039724 RepID=UPI003563F208
MLYNTRMSFALSLHYLDLLGTVVFAFTGLLAASRKQLDLFGAIVIAMVTAIGGGTLRDVILGQPVFWLTQPVYIYVIVLSALFMFFYARFRPVPMRLLLFLDALGLAVFTVIGAQKALALGLSDPIVIMTGIMTGAAGGVIRDVLVGEVPLIFRKEIYATASFMGASVLLLLMQNIESQELAITISILVVLIMRISAIVYNYSLPIFNPVHRGDHD